MDENKICCPKCRHEQENQVECEACGLIFARHDRFQQKKKEQEELLLAARQQQPKSGGRLLQAAILVIATAAVTWYLIDGKKESGPPAQNVVEQQDGIPHPQPIPDIQPLAQPAKPAVQDTHSPATHAGSIEHARMATVSIETPWGTGSGFFVKENYIVTNKHVVELNKDELKKFHAKVETARELVELEKQKIKEMHQKMGELPEGPTRKQLAIIIQQHEEELSKNLPQLEQAEKQLKNLKREIQPGDIKIILANGSEQTANSLMVSENHDLALLSLYANDQVVLQRPPQNTAIQQGDKVYTIGSPVGLRNTVTAGVFSGYRKRESDGALLLQTDAPINPGNSGGPLIDEKGYVRGINTMILLDTQGIGFAIPIETVYEEFQSALY